MSAEEFLSRANKTKTKASEIKEKDDVELPFCRYAERNGCKALKLIYLRKKGFQIVQWFALELGSFS